MKAKNLVKLSFYSRSVNEGFARGALAAFLAQADPTVPELADVAPQGYPCQGIETASWRTLRENGHRQANHPFKDQRIVLLL